MTTRGHYSQAPATMAFTQTQPSILRAETVDHDPTNPEHGIISLTIRDHERGTRVAASTMYLTREDAINLARQLLTTATDGQPPTT